MNTMTKTSLVLLILLSTACSQTKSPDKPNVLFIVVDDLGYHDLSCTGSTFYETPNIDGIANSSMVFTQGYATCQVCSPSRASLMSGKFPARHGITDWIGAKTGEDWRKVNRHNALLPAEYVHQLPHDYITLPEALKEHGYKTFFAGKWHLGGEGSFPEDHGFDINIGGFHAGSPASGRYFAPFNNPKMADIPEDKGKDLSMRLAEETSKFIREHKDTAFYAHLSFYAVHGPIQTSQEKWSRYRAKAESAGLEEAGYELEKRLPIRVVQDNPVYAGLVEQMDEAVGHVLQTLDELGLRENTVVIFTSDNGGVSSGDNFSTSNLPLRGGKGYQWEGGIREPYFISVPWLKQEGDLCDIPVTGTDFYPTILELTGTGLKPAEHSDGVSLLPLLEGKSIAERPLYWHYPHYGNQGGDPSSIIREGDWKLIYYWEERSTELYNLLEDPAETKDVSLREEELAASMTAQLMGWLDAVGANYPSPDTLYNEEFHLQHRENRKQKIHKRLEFQRQKYMSADWKPNEDWWGSQVTVD